MDISPALPKSVGSSETAAPEGSVPPSMASHSSGSLCEGRHQTGLHPLHVQPDTRIANWRWTCQQGDFIWGVRLSSPLPFLFWMPFEQLSVQVFVITQALLLQSFVFGGVAHCLSQIYCLWSFVQRCLSGLCRWQGLVSIVGQMWGDPVCAGLWSHTACVWTGQGEFGHSGCCSCYWGCVSKWVSWEFATPEPVLWGIKGMDHVQLVAKAGLAGASSTGKHPLPSPAVLGCASCVKLLDKAKPGVWIISKELAVFSLWHSLSPSDVCIVFLSSHASVASALHSPGMRGRLSQGQAGAGSWWSCPHPADVPDVTQREWDCPLPCCKLPVCC